MSAKSRSRRTVLYCRVQRVNARMKKINERVAGLTEEGAPSVAQKSRFQYDTMYYLEFTKAILQTTENAFYNMKYSNFCFNC